MYTQIKNHLHVMKPENSLNSTIYHQPKASLSFRAVPFLSPINGCTVFLQTSIQLSENQWLGWPAGDSTLSCENNDLNLRNNIWTIYYIYIYKLKAVCLAFSLMGVHQCKANGGWKEVSESLIQPTLLQVCSWQWKTKTHIKSIFKIL